MRDAFVKTLLVEARKDPNIILITGDLGFGVLDEFQRELPNQFINSGVNEQTMMGMAAGIASTGKRVFVYSIANFPTLRCIEQIRNEVAMMNNPVVVVSVGAGYAYGSQGYTHHALEDIAILRALPNMDVISPCDPYETESITKYLASSKKPSYLRLGKSNEKQIHPNIPEINAGKFNTLRVGRNGSILATGSVCKIALEAADKLNEMGISISVYSVPFISKLDLEELKEISAFGPIVTVEEHSYRGGLGSSVLETCALQNIKAQIHLIAANQNNLSQIGSQDYLRDKNGINVENIISIFNSAS
mgnify:FL=1